MLLSWILNDKKNCGIILLRTGLTATCKVKKRKVRFINHYTWDFLWDILMLPSSRRAALYVNLTLWRARVTSVIRQYTNHHIIRAHDAHLSVSFSIMYSCSISYKPWSDTAFPSRSLRCSFRSCINFMSFSFCSWPRGFTGNSNWSRRTLWFYKNMY